MLPGKVRDWKWVQEAGDAVSGGISSAAGMAIPYISFYVCVKASPVIAVLQYSDCLVSTGVGHRELVMSFAD